eukprot:TRINITY_DN12357_c0_g1_i1.p1 TRINITY_DN12357_c0_g1~~TRINITY_DN12357_c0_g1_i1.p1  ORF type:complete len:725 (+),score=227.37 TRINITY_DN12357_c0_g1_i1:86-2260(+)
MQRGRGALPAVLCAVVCALLLEDASAHKSLVCSATAPSLPNIFTFFLCTYHPNPVQASQFPCTADACVPRCPAQIGATGGCCLPPPPPGRVCGHLVVHEHDGDRSTDAGTWCTLQNQIGGSTPTTPDDYDDADPGLAGDTLTVAQLEANMKDGSVNGRCITRAVLSYDNKTALPLMLPDSTLSCYHHNSANNPEFWGTAVVGNSAGLQPSSDTAVEHITCTGSRGAVAGKWAAHERPIKTCYAIVVDDPGVKAGTYYAYTDGTDVNLEPSNKLNGRTPCGMQRTEPYYFDISVADGGNDCTTTPFQDVNVVPASIANCDGAVQPRFSGFICSVVCNKGFRRVGNLQCANGVWTPYECTNQPFCLPPGEPGQNNNFSIPGNNGSLYVSQVFDGNPGPGSVPVEPGCGLTTKAGTYCNYTCNNDPDPYCSPSRSTPTQNYPIGFRNTPMVRSSILCGRDGRWYPGRDFCGCNEPPCLTPTPTTTPTFSRSFSPTPTFSPTFSPTTTRTYFSPTTTPTFSPTSTVTPYPLCLFGTPIGTTFCVDNDTFVWWPWLLLLLLVLMCCCVALCMLLRRCLKQPGPGVQRSYLPALEEEDEINVRVAKPEEERPEPPSPPVAEVNVSVSKVPPQDVNVRVSKVPEADVRVGVTAVQDEGVRVDVHPVDADVRRAASAGQLGRRSSRKRVDPTSRPQRASSVTSPPGGSPYSPIAPAPTSPPRDSPTVPSRLG